MSFTHPHDPYVARRRYWDLYEDCAQLAPPGEMIPYEGQDSHSQRLLDSCDWRAYDITPEHVARARRGYFANISYIDDKIGQILDTLAATRQEAVIVFLSDHGDMLGERGLWFKMHFFEGSARVPLMLAAPGLDPRSVETPVSTIDVLPTLCEITRISLDEVFPWTDGESLVPLAHGASRTSPVAMEYAAEGSVAPLIALRKGPWKYIRCAADPELLYNLVFDRAERRNLSSDPAFSIVLNELRAEAEARWNLDRYDAEVRESQARRSLVYGALRNGSYFPWDYQPLRAASERYMRNHMDLNVLEESKRFPRQE